MHLCSIMLVKNTLQIFTVVYLDIVLNPDSFILTIKPSKTTSDQHIHLNNIMYHQNINVIYSLKLNI